VIKAMSLDMFFDLLAVRLIGPQAAGKAGLQHQLHRHG
jgi:alkyl sulfatase BDS1-like metallo-beta-lactamase superfamily hydrolase